MGGMSSACSQGWREHFERDAAHQHFGERCYVVHTRQLPEKPTSKIKEKLPWKQKVVANKGSDG